MPVSRLLSSGRSSVETSPLIRFPKGKLAGVLVLLHVDDATGELVVTLTTRSLRLRSHPGETALPGGRWEDQDDSVEATAVSYHLSLSPTICSLILTGSVQLREASEEIALPLEPRSGLFYLTTLPAFTSRTLLVVVPTVYLLVTRSAPTILSQLVPNPDEVDAIFHLPLRSFLGLPIPGASYLASSSPPPLALEHHSQDLVWLSDRLYRYHAFTNSALPSPVSGLTADIIVATALVAFHGVDEAQLELALLEGEADGESGTTLGFVRNAEGQMKWKDIVRVALGMDGQKGLERRGRTEA